MLTNEDLEKIREVVRCEVRKEVGGVALALGGFMKDVLAALENLQLSQADQCESMTALHLALQRWFVYCDSDLDDDEDETES